MLSDCLTLVSVPSPCWWASWWTWAAQSRSRFSPPEPPSHNSTASHLQHTQIYIYVSYPAMSHDYKFPCRSTVCVCVCVCVCTSACVHRVHSVDQQRTVGLWIFHKHDEKLQRRFHHQTRLRRNMFTYCPAGGVTASTHRLILHLSHCCFKLWNFKTVHRLCLNNLDLTETESKRRGQTHQTSCQSVEPLNRLVVVYHSIHPVHKEHDLTESWPHTQTHN